jgi:hypothetical protein
MLVTSDCTSIFADPDATTNELCPGVWPLVSETLEPET